LFKQVLDHEISLALRRSEKDGLNLVLEDPKVLANLKNGYFHNQDSSSLYLYYLL